MINGFEKETDKLSENEQREILPLIVNGLSKRIGEDKIITNAQIRYILSNKYGKKVSDARIRKIINYIRNNNYIPCLIANSKGYYVADKKDEMREYLLGLKERINAQILVFQNLSDQFRDQFGESL